MLDIKFVRNNPDVVKQNIKNKFQDEKLPLVDEVIELDKRNREIKQEVEALRAEKNKASKEIGAMMAQKKIEEAEALKKKVAESNGRINELSEEEKEVEEKLKKNMMIIPNIIDPSVPIGKDDSENVEVERFGEPVVPDFEVPYHTDIMESFNGIDLDAARRVAGNGFYYLMGDIARLHSAVISYARDFMINRGFTYCVPPFMIRSNVVTGVMSFAEMDAMMYKIEGEDLYLIGTSEHSMIGKFIGQTLEKDQVPQTLTSYSPCFRKEKGAHGIEERGVYRIHQFEKQEMIVVCEPEESKEWYDKLWKNTVDLFRSMDIPVRTLECCSGDLADLKVKSVDVEAWSTSWSPKTIQTLIKRLVNKGVLTYEKQSRVFVYTPVVKESEYIGQESNSFLERYYDGDITAMLSAYIENDRLSETEIDTLRSLLSKRSKKGGN